MREWGKTSMTGKRVLFISHEATRTGAPILLLHLVKWLKANSDLSFEIVLRDGGVLEPDFSAIAPVTNFKTGRSAATHWLPRGSTRIGLRSAAEEFFLRRLRARLLRKDFGLVYANTVINADILEFFSDLRCQILCHVHELECGNTERFERVKGYTSHYIAVSDAVRRNLVANHNIPEERIDTVHEFIPATVSQEIDQGAARREVHQRLNISANAMIVGASGTLEWRKGPDLFVRLARSTRERQPSKPIHFVWIGAESGRPSFSQLMHDVAHAGLEGHVHFLGSQPDPLTYFAACDVFAMVSREDPFPLVLLEAASLGKPIVCFDGSGGAKEFVEDDCGYVIPYLDVKLMALRVDELLASEKARDRFGRRAAEKVLQRHDVTVAAPKILNIIKRFL
jgi:glycosyltransferase involved in cell wall biosynthesis